MITFEIDDQVLQMPADFKLVSVINSNLLSTGEISADRTYDVEILDTPINRVALKHLNNLRIKKQVTVFTAVVRDNGAVFINGSFVASNYTSAFSGTLVDSRFLEKIEGKRLKDFTFAPDLVLGNSPQSVADYAKEYHTADHVGFPEILLGDIYNETNPDFTGVVNLRTNDPGKINTMDFVTGENDNKHSILPAFDALWILKTIGSELGYQFKGTLFDQANLQELLIPGGKTLDNKVGPLFLAEADTFSQTITGLTPIAYDNVTGVNWNVVSFAEKRYVVNQVGKHRFKLKFTAKIPVAYSNATVRVELVSSAEGVIYAYTTSILTEVDNFLSFNESITFLVTGETLFWRINFQGYATVILLDVEGIYSQLECAIEPIQYQNLNIYHQSLNYAEYMPDYSASQFIKDFCASFGVNIRFNEVKKEVLFDLKKDIIDASDFWDITDKIVSEENRYYQNIEFTKELGFSISWDNEFNTDQVLVASGDTDIKLKLSPCKLYDFNALGLFGSSKKIWIDSFKVNTDLADITGVKGALRMAFHDADNPKVNLKLNNEQDSVFTQYLESFFQLKNKAVPVVSIAKLNRTDLNKLKTVNKLMIDHTLFLLDTATNPRSNEGPGLTKLRLWKI
jgi:hypothetical protein